MDSSFLLRLMEYKGAVLWFVSDKFQSHIGSEMGAVNGTPFGPFFFGFSPSFRWLDR